MLLSARARRVVIAAATTTVIGLSAVVTAAPASAESRTLKDGRGDTWNVAQAEPTKQGGHPGGDLRKVTIKHTNRKLVITSRFQNMKKVGEGVGVSMNIDVPGDASHGAGLFGTPDSWKGETNFYANDSSTCELSHSMKYRQDIAKLSVPTRRLGRPDWVRLEIYGLFAPNQDKYFVDSAHNAEVDTQLTRRIQRG